MVPKEMTAGLKIHPGGERLTCRLVELAHFTPGDTILDLGCGEGSTMKYLQRSHEIKAIGLDKDPGIQRVNPDVICAPAEEIPLPDHSLDGILMECSLSLMDDRDRVLQECYRVLKPGGMVAIAVLYARGEPARLKGKLGTIDSMEGLFDLLERNQFTVESFEDHTHALQTLWGQMIFDQGTTGFYERLATDREEMNRVRCGYCLIVAKAIRKSL